MLSKPAGRDSCIIAMWARVSRDSALKFAHVLPSLRGGAILRQSNGGNIPAAAALSAQVLASDASALVTARSLHSSHSLWAAEQQNDVDGANQELADFFGTQHNQPTSSASPVASEATCGGAAQADHSKDQSAEAKGGNEGFAYRPNEPRPTAKSATLRHPQAGQTAALSHIDKDGRAAMVDVSHFVSSQREAIASAKVLLGPEVYKLVSANGIKKGDVLTVAQLAGIMGAKQCSVLVPLCHNILITYAHVKLHLEESDHSVVITAEAHTHGPTGVEMEALTAASTAALTIFDMCKAVSRQILITDLRLERKTGGKSGTYDRAAGVGL